MGFFLDQLTPAEDEMEFDYHSLKVANDLYRIRGQPIKHVIFRVHYTYRLVNEHGQPITKDEGDVLLGSDYGELLFIGSHIYHQVDVPNFGKDDYIGYKTTSLENSFHLLTDVISKAGHAVGVHLDNVSHVFYDSKSSTVTFEIDTESG